MPGLPQRWELGNLPSTDGFLSSPLAEIPQVGLGCESHVGFGKSCRIKAESLGPQAWWQGGGRLSWRMARQRPYQLSRGVRRGAVYRAMDET